MVSCEELKVALEVAKKAGDFLQSRHGPRIKFTRKKTSDKLSKDTRKGFQASVEVEVEKIILSILRKKFPDYGYLSEESQPYNVDNELVWVIDPLEGTIAYIHGLENYGTSIALVKRKEIILGIVYCPVLNYLFWAQKGAGAFLNGQRLKVSQTGEISDCLVSIEHKIFRLSKLYPQVTQDLVGQIRRLRVAESCGQELSYVAAGKTDALIKSRQPLYDYAAGKIIVEEAGGKFTDFYGNQVKISFNPEEGIDFLASNGKIHRSLLKYFRD